MVDTALDRIVDLISKNRYISNDSYEYVFFNRTPMTNKFSAFLSPDSKLYSCPLNPLFSFELESGKKFMLKSFELLSLRDGVLPLMHFFYKHPTPDKIDPLIVVDHRLSALVPKDWRDRVVLREMYGEKLGITKEKKKLMIYLAADSLSSPLSLVELELRKIKSQIKNDWEISLFFSSFNKKGEEDCQFDDGHKLKVLQLALGELKDHNVSIINWSEWQAIDLSGCFFTSINPLLFYCSDSYLEHASWQRGALSLDNPTKDMTNSYRHKLSVFHGFNLHQKFDTAILPDENLSHFLKPHLKTIPVDQDDYQQIKLAPPAMEQWGLDIATKLYLKRGGA